MLALLTNYVLDISFGIIWWTTKKTGSALYYGAEYLFWNEESKECDLKKESDYILMTDFNHMLESKNKEIVNLTKKIKVLEG
jgi:hypothetical protein